MSQPLDPSLEAIFLSHRTMLVRTLARIVGCRQTAEDLAQDAYLRMSDAAKERPINALRAFLFRTARNLAFDHLRARRMHGTVVAQGLEPALIEAVPAAEPSPESRFLDRERLARLDEVLGGMTERRRTIFILHKLHGWNYARIAAHTGISESAVQKNIRLALADCLRAMTENDF